jgi:hypothetical protein
MRFSVGSLEEIVDELPVHFFGQNAGVFFVLVAACQQGWEEDSLEVGLREVDEREVAQLLKNRRLLAALNNDLKSIKKYFLTRKTLSMKKSKYIVTYSTRSL